MMASAQSIISRVRAALLRGEKLTAADGLKRFGTMRLAATIHALKRQGLRIKSYRVSVPTRSGRWASVAKYSLGGRR